MIIDLDQPIEIRDARNGEWFWVEKSVWTNPALTSSDKVAYGTLAYFANSKTQESRPSLKKIGAFSGLSYRQTVRSMLKLALLKYLTVSKGGGRGKINRYTLLKAKYAKLALK